MRMIDIIQKKRDGQVLSEAEIRFMTDQFAKGAIPDYQMSAWAMAVYFQGMNSEETAALTLAMAESGEQIDLSAIQGIKVDKHSTGGVGDTTTLVLAPLVASCGVPVAKMSGRGLGHTGGTIDKLESFPGFRVELEKEAFIDLVNRHQLAVMSQSGALTPVDKKLYALRDVTATVDSIPLIASSIMSKKIAAGADAICLDVKTGSGAFMKSKEDARALAKAMVEIGERVGRKTAAVISDMSQPLGRAVGNALEVTEAIATLKGEGPPDLLELSLTLGSRMLCLAEKAPNIEEARRMLEAHIANGQALEKLKSFVQAQGGNPKHVDDPAQLPQATFQTAVCAERSGYVQAIDAQEVGQAAVLLGAGRMTKEDEIDLSVGVILHKKVGDDVRQGEKIATLHMNVTEHQEAEQRLLSAYTIGREKVSSPPLIHAEW